MIIKTISNKELYKAIQVAFENDKEILDLYDPAIKVASIDDIAKDIIRKVGTYDGAQVRGIYDKNKLVGYFVRGGGMLISFALCIEYRVRKFKREFFSLIKKDFHGLFICFLWSKNVRAIRFLEKCGMEVMESNHLITKLICR